MQTESASNSSATTIPPVDRGVREFRGSARQRADHDAGALLHDRSRDALDPGHDLALLE